MKKFKKDFIFSTSTNSFQIEGGRYSGGRTPSIWDKFTEENFYIPKPGVAEREINSIKVASNFYERYKEDALIMKGMGVNAFVYNLDWSRIISDKNTINEEGLQWTKNMFKAMVKNGVKPIPIIFHWDTPLWLEEMGGVLSKEFLSSFRFFSKVLFENLGKYTDIWYVNDENSTFTHAGYMDDYLPPAKKDIKSMFKALHQLNLSAAICKEEFDKAKSNNFLSKSSLIGIDHDWSPAIPYSDSPEDIEAAKRFDEYHLKMYLDPNILGKYPQVFYDELEKHNIKDLVSKKDLILLKNNALDLVGWNYYRPTYVADIKRKDENIEWHHEGSEYFGDTYICYPKNEKYTSWNWLINTSMLIPGAKRLQKRYNKPLMIIENGMGYFDIKDENDVVNDTYRIDYLNQHLREVQRAIEQGVNFIGYSLWTYCDIFSPSGGYRKKYGLVDVDFEGKTLDRRPKSSYFWYKNVIQNKTTYENDEIPYDDIYRLAKGAK